MKAIYRAGAALAVLGMMVPSTMGSAREHHAPAASQQGQAADEAKTAALAEAMRAAELWIEGRRQYRRIPAISAAVVQGDATVWSKGFGTTDRALQQPATPDTIYSICSISKLFTAVALMQQWEQGKVALDAPIETYLPWAKLAADDRESVPVTLRGALTHSAGLPRESDFPYWTGPDYPFPSQAQVRATIGKQAPLYPASTTWQYSNLGLTLVGETVEAVSGQAYADYVSANILDPLGLEDTRPGIPADLYGEQMAVGWGALEADGSRPPIKLFDPAGITPAAGFSASVADLAKFAGWTLRLAESGEAEVLRASTLREMQRVHYISPDWQTSWGLGFSVRQEGGTTVVGHGGSCPGYRSALMIAPDEGMGVAVAMNAMDDALSLNALSFDLDMAMAQYLQAHFPNEPINRDNYALAYRHVGRIDDRTHQIDIISHLGDQLADVIKIRGIGMLISLSRRPAKLAGLLALHEFLERGFDAFKALGDVQSFIQPVLVREKAIMQTLLSDELTLPEDNPLPVV